MLKKPRASEDQGGEELGEAILDKTRGWVTSATDLVDKVSKQSRPLYYICYQICYSMVLMYLQSMSSTCVKSILKYLDAVLQ
jgi:hypothetical protein